MTDCFCNLFRLDGPGIHSVKILCELGEVSLFTSQPLPKGLHVGLAEESSVSSSYFISDILSQFRPTVVPCM